MLWAALSISTPAFRSVLRSWSLSASPGALRALAVGFVVVSCFTASADETRGPSRGPRAQFLSAWVREVLAGDAASAVDLYRQLYEAPFGRDVVPEESRSVALRAALRAAQCFEFLGKPRPAQVAYEWLIEETPATDPLRDLALLRLWDLTGKSAGAVLAAGGETGSAVESAGERTAKQLRELEAAVVEDGVLLASLREVVAGKRTRAREVEELIAEFARRQVQLSFRRFTGLKDDGVSPRGAEAGGFVLDAAPLRQVLGAATGGLRSGEALARALAVRLRDQGLAAGSSGDVESGRERLLLSLAVESTGADVRSLVHLLSRRGLHREDSFRRELERRRADFARREGAALRRELGALLGHVLDQGRSDRALQDLERLRQSWVWAPQRFAGAPEAQWIRQRALLRGLVLAGPSPVVDLAALWRRGEDQCREILEAAGILVELAADEQRWMSPPEIQGEAQAAFLLAVEQRRIETDRVRVAAAGGGDGRQAGAAAAAEESAAARFRAGVIETWFPQTRALPSDRGAHSASMPVGPAPRTEGNGVEAKLNPGAAAPGAGSAVRAAVSGEGRAPGER